MESHSLRPSTATPPSSRLRQVLWLPRLKPQISAAQWFLSRLLLLSSPVPLRAPIAVASFIPMATRSRLPLGSLQAHHHPRSPTTACTALGLTLSKRLAASRIIAEKASQWWNSSLLLGPRLLSATPLTLFLITKQWILYLQDTDVRLRHITSISKSNMVHKGKEGERQQSSNIILKSNGRIQVTIK